MSSKLIQMCATLHGRRHLVNAFEVNTGWFIPFVDKRVGGRCVNPVPFLRDCHAAGHCSSTVNVGQTAFPDPPTESETSAGRGVLDLENFRISMTTPRSDMRAVAELLLCTTSELDQKSGSAVHEFSEQTKTRIYKFRQCNLGVLDIFSCTFPSRTFPPKPNHKPNPNSNPNRAG